MFCSFMLIVRFKKEKEKKKRNLELDFRFFYLEKLVALIVELSED